MRLVPAASTSTITSSSIITRNRAKIRYGVQPGDVEGGSGAGIGGGGGGSTSVIGAGVVEYRVGGAARTDAGGVAEGDGSAREGYGPGAGRGGVGAASVVKAPIALQELRVSELIALIFQ